ncbi:MAG: single-stranded-DNA-specific exonuclease RecJ [Clostridia bacterium]|nr:single-stranded-DNA-specific exonuclease RecJ [Clostridia bacterium]
MKRIIPEYEFSAEQLNTVKSLAAECNLLEETVKILYGRGIDDKDKILNFIHPSREHFISPFKMSGMQEAVDLITRARDEEWAVVVYGDYDADGVCAATIMANALRDFGIEPSVYVPERREGYGLSCAAIDNIFEEDFPQLFITVDCGISCADEVEYIKEQGAEVIVTDHHELPDKIPDCICINPKFNDGYIYDNLCGAGVALKVACALNGDAAYKYLDFAAIATVADSVPLTGENRDIVFEGLKLINEKPRACYSHFLSKTDAGVNSQAIAFSIAPKINAAGRMGDAKAALTLFSETDENKIFDLAAKLTAYNTERQKYCDELYLSAKNKINERGGAYGRVIMLWDEDWNAGFVGIVAARLADEFSRPVLLFVRNGENLKGSARSIENVNIFEALKACDEYLTEFGGHAQAAGVNVEVKNFEKLEAALNEYLTQNYSAEDFISTLYINGVLTSQYSVRFAKELEMLEPFGVGNRRPMFEIDGAALDVRPVKPLSPHVSVKSSNIELMYFGGAKFTFLLESRAPKRFIFEYNVSTFRGREYVKGFIRDVVLSNDAGKSAAQEIAVNNIVTLSAPKTACEIVYKTQKEIREEVTLQGYGTLFIAHEYSTLESFSDLIRNLPVELFSLSGANLADCVLLSPNYDCDLSGYRQIVFLDEPPAGVRISSLKGKSVIICSDIEGNKFLKGLPCTREDLLKIFAMIAANAGNAEGADSAEVAIKTALGFTPPHVAFALEVFRQLNLLSFEGGKLTLFRGVKTELTNSELYNIATKFNG